MAKAKNGYVALQIKLRKIDYELLTRVAILEEKCKSPNECVKKWVLENLADYENMYSQETLYQLRDKEK